MITQILVHTPTWVFILLAALVALGLSQTRTRQISSARATVLPVAIVVVVVVGVLRTFSPAFGALIGGVGGLGLCLGLLGQRLGIQGACWLPDSDRFLLPGS